MTRAAHRRVAGISFLAAATLALGACGGGASNSGSAGGSGDEIGGNIPGAGASSQENAMQAWTAIFMEQHPSAQVSYDPVGSGSGRTQFLQGATLFAGSDKAMDAEEVSQASERCFGGEVLELPLYISPIAVAYNLPGVEGLQLTPDVIAKIFSGQITSWNDPAIAESNPGVDLPSTAIVPVNRADDSGTTENFTDYLSKAAPESWTYGDTETWPISGTQSAQGTSGVVQIAASTEGAIVYADASQVGSLQTAKVGVGNEFVELSPQSAAAVLDVSQPTEDATDKRLTYQLARDTTESGVYPIVLVSYTIACDTYDNPQDAANVKALLTSFASTESQDAAAQPDVAGSAPISDDLRTKVTAVIDSITAKN